MLGTIGHQRFFERRSAGLPIVLVGGGLANILLALRLKQIYPLQRFLILERGPLLGGEHTWSFHVNDVASSWSWIKPLVTKEWPGYSVLFPDFRRQIDLSYAAIRSRDLSAKVWPLLGSSTRLETEVQEIAAEYVILSSGEKIDAALVVDGRGFLPQIKAGGWQNFFGLVVRTKKPHGLYEPILKDATVSQKNAYRFIYVLPWNEDTLLIEDTRYANHPESDGVFSAKEINIYAESHGWQIREVLDSESACLPIPCGEELCPRMSDEGVIRSGVRAGLYHSVTGYSFGNAVSYAERFVASLEQSNFYQLMHEHATKVWQDGWFLRRLNAMFFRAAKPEHRWKVMRQFYSRDLSLIARFYSMRLKKWDGVRLVSGIPPVPLARGIITFFNLDGGRIHGGAE